MDRRCRSGSPAAPRCGAAAEPRRRPDVQRGSATEMAMMRVKHISMSIDRAVDEVYAFLADPGNFERWASGLGKGLTPIEGQFWRADGPEGPVTVRFSALNPLGIVDHEVTTPAGM